MGAAVGLSAQSASPAAKSSLMQAHRQPADDVVAALHTDLRRGLTDAEVRTRLERYGRNELATGKPTPAWVRFVEQFQDVLVILLLIAAGISVGLWAYEGAEGLPYEAIAILAVVLLNAVLGYVQQARAEAAVAALRTMSAADAAVIHSGERRTIPAAEVVPGDIILIEEGDTIPADGRLLESAALQTAEAALTGESLPVSKDTDVIADDVALGDRYNVRGLSAIVDVLILGVALAVAAVPEGLPAVVTAVLAIGVQRMARRHAIVGHLAAVETLGSASVIASDKTGTLTKNEMTVRVVVTASGRVTFGGSGYVPDGNVDRDDGGPIEGASG